jgi:type II secretory pathway predicted ATPase ExeA
MEKDDENYIPEDIDTSLTKEDKDLDEIKAEEEPVNEPAEEIKIQVKAPDSEQTVDMPVMPSVVRRKMTVLEWLNAMNWRSNPFIFNIVPSLFVGYKSQTERISMALEEKHKFMLILGPTGSGKTTLLKWLSFKLKKYDVLYIGKPPQKPEEFVEIISSKYRAPWYAFWSKKIRSIYEIPDFLNKKLGRKTLVILLDEAHEANTDILEWLRVLNDQVENMSIVMSGLPVFEESLKNSLETFVKRVTAKIELLSLTKEETKELISKRIIHAGGRGDEFSDAVVSSIYEYTGGFPREIIRVCDEIVNNAIMSGSTEIEFTAGTAAHREEPVHTAPAEKMTAMQKEILEMLSKRPMTPGQIADALDLEKYKSRQHAVRSVNNVVKALYETNYLERRKEEKAFVYSLSARYSTLFVKR